MVGIESLLVDDVGEPGVEETDEDADGLDVVGDGKAMEEALVVVA